MYSIDIIIIKNELKNDSSDSDRLCVDVESSESVSPLTIARRRKGVLGTFYAEIWPGGRFLGDEVNSIFDVFLLARLIVAGQRSGQLAPPRRALGSKDVMKIIAKFLVRKLLSPGA